jgi:hypothetical protein
MCNNDAITILGLPGTVGSAKNNICFSHSSAIGYIQ